MAEFGRIFGIDMAGINGKGGMDDNGVSDPLWLMCVSIHVSIHWYNI
jgi:hypothetical protein